MNGPKAINMYFQSNGL